MGGVVTTAADLMRWDDALAGDAVLPIEARERMLVPGPGDYACGWFVDVLEDGRARTWHGGSVFGYEALFVRYPRERTALVVMTNEECDIEEIEEAFEDALELAEGQSEV
jgi:CubicO group peptidase (beta-lactamase class C family)